MSIGEDIVKSIEDCGSSSEKIVVFLQELKSKTKKSGKQDHLLLTIEKLENAYNDISEYYQPPEAVLKNIKRRIGNLRPILESALESAGEEDQKAIKAIVANQKMLNQFLPDKSVWENLKIKVSNKLRSPNEE